MFYIWGGTQQGEEDAADRQRVNVSNFLDTTGGQAGPRATAARRKSQAARQKLESQLWVLQHDVTFVQILCVL